MNLLEIIKSLISVDSVSGNEVAIQKKILEILREGSKTIEVGKNILVRIPGQNRSKAIIFNAHMDTVAVGNVKAWKVNPFAGKIIDGKIYGLGACDDKGAVASLLLLAEKFITRHPACDVWLMFVVKEELDGSGTEEALNWFKNNYQSHYRELAAVIGEPTELNKIEIGHRGNIFLKITTYGETGHASRPIVSKKHAVEKMYEISSKLKKLVKLWQNKFSDSILGMPTIGVLTSIVAGNADSPNKFPDTCTATFDVRTTPALHHKALNLIKSAIGSQTYVGLVCPPVPCGYTSPDETIVKVFKEVTEAKVGIFPMGSCDMPFFTESGIPTVIFGPGDPRLAHKENEYCEVKQIEDCVEIYSSVIAEFAKESYNSK